MKAAALPLLVALATGAFLVNNARGSKKNESWGWTNDEKIPPKE